MKIFRNRPWLWIVIGLALFLTLDIAFLVIALQNQPLPAP